MALSRLRFIACMDTYTYAFRRCDVPRPRDQFFEPQPARKSRTSSPGFNTTAGAVCNDSAILRLTASKSAFTHPTVESSISPSCATQNIVGTLVSPYAFDTGYLSVSSSNMGNVTPNSLANAVVSFGSFCETPMTRTPLSPYASSSRSRNGNAY